MARNCEASCFVNSTVWECMIVNRSWTLIYNNQEDSRYISINLITNGSSVSNRNSIPLHLLSKNEGLQQKVDYFKITILLLFFVL